MEQQLDMNLEYRLEPTKLAIELNLEDAMQGTDPVKRFAAWQGDMGPKLYRFIDGDGKLTTSGIWCAQLEYMEELTQRLSTYLERINHGERPSPYAWHRTRFELERISDYHKLWIKYESEGRDWMEISVYLKPIGFGVDEAVAMIKSAIAETYEPLKEAA